MISVPPMEGLERRLYSRPMTDTGSTMDHSMRAARWFAISLLALGCSMAARAQFPERPITMIVPFPPGGVADTVARPVAEALARELKQPVVVENKAGAGGALGIGVASRAPARRLHGAAGLSSISILPEADKILGRKPAYQLNQFKPIARFTADPTVLVVRADAPWKTLAEFIADARSASPARYNYGSSGNYGTMHVPMEMLKAAAGFRMIAHSVHRRRARRWSALLGGQVDAIASGPSTRGAADPGRQAARAGALGRAAAGSRCPTCRA